MKTENGQQVLTFMEVIWNDRNFDRLNDFLHDDFFDHSLPSSLHPNAEGLKKWVIGTGEAFEHRSVIEEQATEDETSIIKIRMQLKHIGLWRGIPATGIDLSVVGYRCFRLHDKKIIEHWALLDGNSIENQLKQASEGCKVQV
jgi:predicted ester cyclase